MARDSFLLVPELAPLEESLEETSIGAGIPRIPPDPLLSVTLKLVLEDSSMNPLMPPSPLQTLLPAQALGKLS